MKIAIDIKEGVEPARITEIVHGVAQLLRGGFMSGFEPDHSWQATGGIEDEQQPPSLLEQGFNTVQHPDD